MESQIAVLDMGTTRIKAFIYNQDGQIIRWNSRHLSTWYPQKGWVEQRPLEIWDYSLAVLKKTLLDNPETKVDCLAITNQRSTSLVWERESGKPLTPAITWQDGRTGPLCQKINRKFKIPYIQKTAQLAVRIADGLGLPRGIRPLEMARTLCHFGFHPSLSAVHLAWSLKELEKNYSADQLCFGTLDSWLIWKLTGGKVHATDITNASVTGLYQIFQGEWNHLFLKILNIDPSILPSLKPSSHFYGTVCPSLFGREIPITGVIADQQASMVALGCLQKGKLKCTIGTGAFADLGLGHQLLGTRAKLAPLVALSTKTEVFYLLEGMMNGGGNLIDWAVELGLASSAKDTSAMAFSVKDNQGLYMVPAFSGLFAPHWNTGAQALMVGLQKNTSKASMVRAMLESMGYQLLDVYLAFQQETHIKASEIWIDGGVGENDFVLQWMANMVGVPVIRPKNLMATSLGAAYTAGLGIGIWKTLQEFPPPREDRIFYPQLSENKQQRLYSQWKGALERSKKTTKN